jgi:hypothetical protein
VDLVFGRCCCDVAAASWQRKSEDETSAVVDMRDVRWVEPRGLIAVLLHAEYQKKRYGRRVRVLAPSNPSLAAYLCRMRLDDHLDRLGIEHDIPTIRRWTLDEGVLLECRMFSGGPEADALAQMLVFALKDEDPDGARALHRALMEVASNVAQHAGVPHGYMAAQRTHKDTPTPRVYFAVGDIGTTIPGALAADYSFDDDVQAIKLALLKGVSDSGDSARGKGLATVRHEVIKHRGELHIASRRGLLRVYPGGYEVGTRTNRVRGTLIQGFVRYRRNS